MIKLTIQAATVLEPVTIDNIKGDSPCYIVLDMLHTVSFLKRHLCEAVNLTGETN